MMSGAHGAEPLLDQSYRHCRQVVLAARSNLGRAFWLLKPAQRCGMDALYAFARRADDLVDSNESETVRRSALAEFRLDFERSLSGELRGPQFPALIDTMERYQIEPQYCFDLLDGCAMDLSPRRYANWDELQEYCLRVASSVGLACLPIWDCKDERARQPAIDCGLALQLTNILRDIRGDAELGRVYLPQEELARFGLTEADLSAEETSGNKREFVLFQVQRAKRYYASAKRGQQFIPEPAKRLYWLMRQTYERLLLKIESDPTAIFRERVKLNRTTQLWLAARAVLRLT